MMATPSPHTASDFSPANAHPCHGITTRDARRRKSSDASGTRPIRELGLMRDTGEHDTARFVGSGTGIHFIRNVHLRLARRTADRQQRSGQTLDQLVPGEDDQLWTSEGGIWNAQEVTDDESGPQPSFNRLVEWSQSFFESWHPALPFLHGPDVLRIFQDISSTGLDSISVLDRSIIRAVLSISLADSRQGKPLPEPIPLQYLFKSVNEAVSESQFALCQPASVRATQAAVAIQLFLMSMLRLNAASRLGGLIVRMAFHLGLHRCPARYPFFNAEEGSKRRRLFWCIYASERFLSQSLGVPLDIRDDDLDVCYPGEEIHGTARVERDQRLNLLTLVAKHARIRGLILELRNKCTDSRQDTVDHGIAVQAELAKWSNEIQDFLEEGEDELNSTRESSGSQHVRPMHRLMLTVLKYESTISLNRPLMASDPAAPSYSAALQACISAAKSICIAMRRHLVKHKTAEGFLDTSASMPLLWPSFTWSIWISAFVLGYAAFERRIAVESALKHIRSSQDTLRHIASRNTSWPEYCLSAIDELIISVEELPKIPRDLGPTNSRTLNLNNTDSLDGTRKRHFSALNQGSEGQPAAISSSILDSSGIPQDNGQASRWEEGLGWQHAEATAEPPGRQHRMAPAGPSGDAANRCSHTLNMPSFQASMPISGTPGVPSDLYPAEGQESMVWYDQLFSNSFSAIENPFLAAAQFDSSIDPTWSYLR